MPIPLTVLGVIDGFGYSQSMEGNAIANTLTPNLDYLWSHFPHFLVRAAEEEVGLSFGEVGNSEVGHIAIGTGRVVPQSLALINKSVEDGTFHQNSAFLEAANLVKQTGGNFRIMGIISTPGVHGHLDHILELIKFAAEQGLKNVYLDLILDGRDSGPKDTPLYLKEINSVISSTKVGTIATLAGRAFSMDRNNNWERTQKAYDTLMGKSDKNFPDVQTAIDTYYKEGLDDENIPPTTIGTPIPTKTGDAIIFTNYREDRARQLTKALAVPDFKEFPRPNHPGVKVFTMTEYEQDLPLTVAFPMPELIGTLSDVLAENNIPQIHIAETEKYAHVTYFFNGGRESKKPGEEFFMVPSVKPEEFVNHPEMSALGVTNAVVESIKLGYKFIIFNFANCDMIGHTGNYEATRKAVATVDNCFNTIWQATAAAGGRLFITADHGNAEMKMDPKTGESFKEHTISPVPFIAASMDLYQEGPIQKIGTGAPIAGLLSDTSPTILTLLGLPIPEEMTGTSLL